ncbi:MAG: hypothetical protein SYC29_08485 [Planctomycetota bacterium]|nr:hypothetical protein [Planctomycetota bacterium]
MRASEFTMEQRRSYLRAIFAKPRGARLHELIDAAVNAFSDETAAEAPKPGYRFPASAERAAVEPAKIAG